MTPQINVEHARQLLGLLERLDAIKARFETLSEARNSKSASERLMLSRLVYNTNGQLRSLSIKFGHSDAAMHLIAGKFFAPDDVEFIRDQCADELAYKQAHGDQVTDEVIVAAAALEIEEMLPILHKLVDRCATLLTAQL
jgi:hypothetical protein